MMYLAISLFIVAAIVFAVIGRKRCLYWVQGIGLGMAIAGFMFSMLNLYVVFMR